MWRERRGVPAVPSLELIGYVTRWPNPPGLMCGRPDRPWGQGRLSPPPRASVPWEQGRGTARGSPPLSSYLLFPPPPGPRGDIYSWATSADWQATCLLFECPAVPEDPGRWDTFLRTCLWLLRSRGEVGSPPVIAASSPCPAPGGSPGESGFSQLSPALALGAGRTPSHRVLCLPVVSTESLFPVSLVSINLRPLRTSLGFRLPNSPKWKTLCFL